MSSIDESEPNVVPAAEDDDLKPIGLGRRLIRRPLAVVCLFYLLVIVMVSILAPLLMPDVGREHAGDMLATLQGPSGAHLLGTDSLGRDVLQRLLVGTRVTLVGALQALIVVVLIGVPAGLAGGYFGGKLDRLISWVGDLIFSMPAIVVMLVVLGNLPGNMTAAMSAFGLVASPTMMRVVRSATMAVREELYVAAAQVAGLSERYIIVRHVLPRVAGAAITQSSLVTASALIAQTGLAFLGLIAVEPAPSWGGMVAAGLAEMLVQPWLIWPPGVAITVTVVALGLLSDSLRDATAESWTPPTTRRRRRTVNASSTPQVSARVIAEPDNDALLTVRHLNVAFTNAGGTQPVIEDVSFSIQAGETVGLVGESGSGKSITAMTMVSLLPAGAHVESGSIRFDGREICGQPEREVRKLRGSEIGLVAQEPMISLNPSFRIGNQLLEVVRKHNDLSRADGRDRVIDLLRQVRIPDPEEVARRYPHQISGGMAQRVAIARALAGEPKLLIADEPTTALDVTVQAETLQLLREIQAVRHMAILLVTHDWGVVADICDRAVVLYAGQVVEQAPILELFARPQHPYSKALIASDPRNAAGSERLATIGGSPPSLGNWPSGCRFSPRCGFATTECAAQPIQLQQLPSERETRCIHHSEVVHS